MNYILRSNLYLWIFVFASAVNTVEISKTILFCTSDSIAPSMDLQDLPFNGEEEQIADKESEDSKIFSLNEPYLKFILVSRKCRPDIRGLNGTLWRDNLTPPPEFS